MNKHKSSRLLVLLLIIASAWLGGCGQKGPLYLPNEQHRGSD
jgi:predicted small lipoprotein YifL